MMSRKIYTKSLLFLLLVLVLWYGYYRYLNRNAIDSIIKLDFEDNPEITKGHVPKICTGLRLVGNRRDQRSPVFCPPHFAFMTAEDLSSSRFRGTPASVPLNATCCPLPADDILTEEHVYNIEKECPASYIATGVSGSSCGDNCFIRCTRINTERYLLGRKHQGVYWKRPGTYPAAGRGGAVQILLTEIPFALRYADGFSWSALEQNLEPWDQDGCISAPFGSLVVEKRSSGCGGLYFRPLLFKDGGRAVRTFAECDAIRGIAEGEPFCQPPNK